MIELKDSIMDKLRCSKCYAYLSCSPVMLKLNGQNICGRCTIHQEEEEKTAHAVRNKVYEEIASVVAFPCRYRSSGCSKLLQWNNVHSHEISCDFKTFDCPVVPLDTCNWNGTNSDLLEHYKEEHPHLLLDHPCKISPDLNKDNDNNFLLTYLGFLFLIQVKLNSNLGKFWSCVRYLGNSVYLSNFEFSLEVRNFQALMKKTKNVSPRDNLVMNRNNCIEVNLKTLVDFLGDDNNISFVIWVKKKGNICFKCKRDLKPMKLYCLGEGFHCDSCRNDLVDVDCYSKQFQFQHN